MDAPEDLVIVDIGGDPLEISTAIVEEDGEPEERLAILAIDSRLSEDGEIQFNFDGPQLDILIAKLQEVRLWIGG